MNNQLDELLKELNLTREDFTDEEIKQMEEALKNGDDETLYDIIGAKAFAGENNKGMTEEPSTDNIPTEETSTDNMPTDSMPTEDTMPTGNEEQSMPMDSMPTEETPTDSMPTETEEPDLTKDTGEEDITSDKYVQEQFDNFKNGNKPAYNSTSSNSIDDINPDNPETIESLSIDEMLNILSGKEDENLKDNTEQMNGEDPETYVDEVKEAVYNKVKEKIQNNGSSEDTEEEGAESSANQNLMSGLM